MEAHAMAHPAVGDPAPDLVFKNSAGEVRHLSSGWADGPALMVWLRHLG
jgi:hypothetical protein